MPKENLKQFFSIVSVSKVLIKMNVMINWSTLNTFPPYRKKTKKKQNSNNSFMTKQPRKEILQKSKQQRKFNKLRTSESKKKNSTETKRNLIILKKAKRNYFSNLNLNVVQKQSPEVFYNKRCRHFLLKNRLWHRCFPWI